MSRSYTIKSNNGVLKEIITNVGISKPFTESNITSVKYDDDRIHHTNALWDTGATNSVITVDTAKKMNLIPISKCQAYHAGGTSIVNVYMVNIYLPNNLIIPNVMVSECQNNVGRMGFLIGMDIIGMSDFSITNVNRRTIFTFRLPSIKVIDYENEI
jgi:hypothetical protein